MRRLLGYALSAALAAVPAQTQQRGGVPQPAFETASIRPARLSDGCFSMLPPGGTQYAATCVSLLVLMEMTYNTNYIEGGGKALDTLYDVRASTGDRPWTQESIRPMMQQLLSQRFHLVVHAGKRELSGYRMVIAKGGPKLQSASAQSIPKGQKAGEGSQDFVFPGHAQGRGLDARGIANLLSLALRSPVSDATGLTGVFNVDLSYAPDNSVESNLPSFFTAVEEQLGLKLEPARVSVDTVVIDSVDPEPTPN